MFGKALQYGGNCLQVDGCAEHGSSLDFQQEPELTIPWDAEFARLLSDLTCQREPFLRTAKCQREPAAKESVAQLMSPAVGMLFLLQRSGVIKIASREVDIAPLKVSV